MRRWRIALCTAGIALGLFGAFRLLTQVPITSVLLLASWMIAAVVIHDGVLSPLVIGVGAVVARVPPRARRYLQAGLIVAGCVTVIALPLIARRGSQPSVKAILRRNYAGNLTIIVGIVAALSLALYAVHVAHDVARGRRCDDAEPK
jgi:hypothetical protein